MKKLRAIGMVLAMSGVLMLGLLFGCAPQPDEIKVVTKGDGVSLKVGIISDTQLAHTPDYDYGYEQNLLLALEGLKARGAEAIVFAGDFGNLLNDYMYQSFNRVWNHVYKNVEAPEKVFVMGNHDYWFENDYNMQLSKKQKIFKEHMGDSPWTHKVINGYHFIGFSPTSGNSYAKKEKWFKKELDVALADGDKPVFVVTHHNPVGTVYGSVAVDGGQGWGLEGLDELFRGNERLVNISGHSHYSIIDERSIYQDSYTALQTQSLSYIELEGGKENGSIPPDAEKNPMMMLMTLSPSGAEIERIGVRSGISHGENWTLDFPLKKETYKYTTAIREAAAMAPVMPDTEVTVVDGKDKKGNAAKCFAFAAGKGQGTSFVHSYHITLWQDGQQKHFFRYFSDFYNGVNEMAQTVSLPINADVAAGEYTIKITALESFGKVSNEIVKTVTVVK